MVLDVADSDMSYVVKGGSQSDGIGHVGCSCLEPRWRYVVLGTLDGHVFDHVATALPGLHLFQQFTAAIDHADAVRAINLMSAEDEEVSPQLLNVHGCVGNRLGTVYQYGDLMCVGDVDDARHIVDGAERVVHMTY